MVLSFDSSTQVAETGGFLCVEDSLVCTVSHPGLHVIVRSCLKRKAFKQSPLLLSETPSQRWPLISPASCCLVTSPRLPSSGPVPAPQNTVHRCQIRAWRPLLLPISFRVLFTLHCHRDDLGLTSDCTLPRSAQGNLVARLWAFFIVLSSLCLAW